MTDNNNFHIPQHVIKQEPSAAPGSSPSQHQFQVYYSHQQQQQPLSQKGPPTTTLKVIESMDSPTSSSSVSVTGLDYSTHHHHPQQIITHFHCSKFCCGAATLGIVRDLTTTS